MKLVASMMVGPGERGRYLNEVLAVLTSFCDEIRIVSEDPLLQGGNGVEIAQTAPGTFFQHEGRARQALLTWTLQGNPSHILAVDADELVTDGHAVRDACELDHGIGVWTLRDS